MQVTITLKKPAESRLPSDWTLGVGWAVEPVNGGEKLVKSAGAGDADFLLPLPGKYRLTLIGSATSLEVNGTPVSLPATLAVEAGVTSSISISAATAELTTVLVEHWDGEFYVEGVEGASVIFDAQDVRTPNKRSAARSRNVVVPATANNLRALGELFEINHEGDFDPRKRAACRLSVDGITALDGYAQVIQVNRGGNTWDEIVSFELQCFDRLADFFSALGDKKISDLDFSEYAHNLGATDITRAGWREDPAEHLVKKNGAYVQNYAHTLVSASGTVSLYTETTGDDAGVKYFKFTTPSAHALEVGYFVWIKKNTNAVGDHRKHVGEHRVKKVLSPTEFVVTTSSAGGGDTGGTINGTSVSIWGRNALGFGYVYVPADLGLDADMSLGGSYDQFYDYPAQASGSQTYQVTASRMRPSVFLREVIEKAATTAGFSIVSEFFAGEDFSRIAVLPWHKETVSRDNYGRYEADGTTPRADYEEYNSPIDPTAYLPGEKLSSLIGDVIKMFNLYVQVVDKTVFLEPRDTFYNEKSLDWNAKVDQSSLTIKLLPEHTAKNYEYTPAKANDSMAASVSAGLTREYGSLTVVATNEFNNATASSKLSIVEPTVIVAPAVNIASAVRRNFYSASSKQSDGKPLRKGVRLVYVSCKGISGQRSSPAGDRPFKIWKNWPGEDPLMSSAVADDTRYVFPAGTHVDSVCFPMFDLNFRTNPLGYPPTWGDNTGNTVGRLMVDEYGLYGRFHQRSVRAATSARSRLLAGTGIFTHTDVTTLDFRRLISFDGQLWTLNKIEFDLMTMVGKFELLLAQDLGSTSFLASATSGSSKPPLNDDDIGLSVLGNDDEINPVGTSVTLVDAKPYVIRKPYRPLQRFTVFTKNAIGITASSGSLIDGLSTKSYSAAGAIELWSPDGVNWETLSEPAGVGVSGYSGYSGVGGALTSFTPGVITVAPTGRQDNYNPSGLSDATTIFLNPTESLVISGLQGGSNGRVIFLMNVSDYLVILENDSPDSTASNRFYTTDGMAIFLMPRRSVSFIYNTTQNRWVCTDRQNQFDECEDFVVDTVPSASADVGRFYQHAQNGGSIGSGSISYMRGPGILVLQTGTTNAVGNAKLSMGGRTGFEVYSSGSYFLGLTQLALDTTFTAASHPMQVATGLLNTGAITTWAPPSSGAYWFLDTSDGVSTDWRITVSTPGAATSTALVASTGVVYSLGVFTRENSGADFFYSTNQVKYTFAGSKSGSSTQGAFVTGAWGSTTIANKRVFVDQMAYNLIQTK